MNTVNTMNIVKITNSYDTLGNFDLDPDGTDLAKQGLGRFQRKYTWKYTEAGYYSCENGKNNFNGSFITQMGDSDNLDISPEKRLWVSRIVSPDTEEISLLLGHRNDLERVIPRLSQDNTRGCVQSPDSRYCETQPVFFHSQVLSNRIAKRAGEIKNRISHEMKVITEKKGMRLEKISFTNSNGDLVTVSEHRHCNYGINPTKRMRVKVVPTEVFKVADGVIRVVLL